MRLTILVDNTPHAEFEGEPGFAAAVENDGRLALFDTGIGDLIVRNAARAGIDLERVEVIALSHGHYDHTGGLEAVLRATGPVRLVGHPAAFEEKIVRNEGFIRTAGMSLSAADLEARGATIEMNTGPVELVNGVWLTGAIPRQTDYETVPAAFVLRRGDGFVHDEMPDDQSLFVRTDAGVVVIAGCAHAGIVNTLRHVQALRLDKSIVAVFGGSHLVNADDARIDRTIEVLRELDLKAVGLCHCTGAYALDRIEAALPDRFVRVHSGFAIEL